ncbi:Sodium/potassium-transporting ATPase subunit beta-2 [Lamellibrachia satsuma]|nr:Sodium/potassium-transporting ATPase subunit beta-2 [Lamellibrachia satsuma]
MVATEADYALRPLLIFILWPLAILVGVCYAFYRQTSNHKSPWKPLLDYVFNPKANTCFDRSLPSWVLLVVFYLAFGVCLAAFIGVLAGFVVLVIDKNYPTRQALGSMIKDNPGLGYRPVPSVDTNLVRFIQGMPSSYKLYTDHIQAYLDQYEHEKQEGENFQDCTNLKEVDRDKEKVCRFNIDTLGEKCQQQKDFGYDEGQPCILLKLNKIYGWEPKNFSIGAHNKVPEEIKGTYTSSSIHVTCHGENPADEENMGKVTFYPPNGFPFFYYPYLNQEGYRQPLVFAHFERPKNGVLIQVWCKAWASNVYHSKNDRAGSVHFELLVD